MIKVGIITISDKGSRGEREDLSVEEIKKLNKELYSRGLKKGERLLIPAASNTTDVIGSDPENILPL